MKTIRDDEWCKVYEFGVFRRRALVDKSMRIDGTGRWHPSTVNCSATGSMDIVAAEAFASDLQAAIEKAKELDSQLGPTEAP